MTCVTIGQSGSVDVVLPNELFAERFLIRRRGIMHVEDIVLRAQESVWLPVAIETPPHVELSRFPRERHLVYLTVASRATDALVQMNAVVEIDVIRQIVHARPFERTAGLPTVANWLQNRRVFPNLRVARHAGLRRRKAGKCRILD